MFKRKKVKPWFFKSLKNLFMVFVIYRFARSFLMMVEKQGKQPAGDKLSRKKGKK
ncbi:MAG: hypothetical protein ACLFQB_08175 [Chitinispirillaceae bacterium]